MIFEKQMIDKFYLCLVSAFIMELIYKERKTKDGEKK